MTTKKNCLLLTILTLFSTPFLYMLNLYPQSMGNALYWCISFLLSFSFLYLAFLISTISQVILIKVFHLFPIKVISLYPFTYDGKLRFHPILLLYNPEGFHNSLWYNLAIDRKHDAKLKENASHFLLVRKISCVAAYVSLYLVAHSYTFKTTFVFLICLFTTLLLSYFQSDSWHGFDYVKSKGVSYIKTYLYSVKTIPYITSSEYAAFLHPSNVKSCDVALPILENYLYRCILEKTSLLSGEDISMLLDTYEHESTSYHLALDAQMQGLIRLLGWTGICCQNPTYISLAIDLLLKNQMYAEDIPISTLSTKISNQQMKEIHFLRNPIDFNDNPLQLMYFHNIFSIYESIFPKR